MFLKILFLGLLGGSFGLLASAGVFTVLVAVGLVPRFAGKTHTGKKILLYEEMEVAGTIFGGLITVFAPFLNVGEWLPDWAGTVFIIAYGLFGGMFVGCLALAIAEMLDSIPIFTRRIGFRHGIGIVILCIAVGKLWGSLIYFVIGLP